MSGDCECFRCVLLIQGEKIQNYLMSKKIIRAQRLLKIKIAL